MGVIRNAVEAMEGTMSEESVRRARLRADREILQVRLSELRRRMAVRQSEIPAFSQSAISKLERRKDMKLSTLIEYLEGIGMGLEIRVYPKTGAHEGEAETLLKV